MITDKQYFGEWRYKPDVSQLHVDHATAFLKAVNTLMQIAVEDGVSFPINPSTRSQVSGSQFGGFRPVGCPIGAVNSSHKQGRGVDIYDPTGEIDAWCMSHAEPGGYLAQYGIYIEHPDATPKWSHWTDRAPPSGNRVFKP